MLTRSLKRSKWTFTDCARFLAQGRNPTYRKLANNTTLVAISEGGSLAYAVKLHATNVVIIYPDDSVRLFSGGWRTVTTKQRINSFSPIGIYQVNRTWRINPDTEFVEGIHLSACGDVLPD